ncbi:chondroitin sulfate ABC exolyase [Nematostella vectensis]|uniref:chondroitin sulfate ABC exolyase n=1 Tax=Nematostella vectensis TaxID=45351 RepID=UPI002076FE62|nr:chondroitin sulfate ABC exolyase [Nematostella vectensis]
MMGCLWFMVFVMCAGKTISAEVTYDFESSDELATITPHHTVQITGERHKHGHHALKWSWDSKARFLNWSLSVPGTDMKRGGLQFHLYSDRPQAGKCLRVCTVVKSLRFHRECTSCFFLSLNFKGWRTNWVKYKEFSGCPADSPRIPSFQCSFNSNHELIKLYIESPDTPGSIFLDFLTLSKDMHAGSRDLVIPPMMKADGSRCFACEEFGTIAESDAVKHTPQTTFWEHAYRWHLRSRSRPPVLALSGDTLNRKVAQLAKMKRRMLDWFSKTGQAYFDLLWSNPKTRPERRWTFLLHGSSDAEACWNKKKGNIQCAHVLFKDISINPKTLEGPSLYCRDCEEKTVNKEMKFRYIFYIILLPMALEYRIWSQVDAQAFTLSKRYCDGSNDFPAFSTEDWAAITGKDQVLGEIFKDTWNKETFSSTCLDRFKAGINALNKKRIGKIMLLFKYIRNEGFAEGSSLGSLDHQLLYGQGYWNAAFLMSDVIRTQQDPGFTLKNLIDTMKWYTEFGELDQKEFEHKGATCDRVRMHMLFRLLTVLSMPEETVAEKNEKVEDMKKLKKWIDVVFTPTEGTYGLFKPDYLGFHHQFFYAGAYLPEALYMGTLVAYVMRGTGDDLALSSESEANLAKALGVLRDISVKYSTPSSTNGRYPTYFRSMLSKMPTAFARMALNPPYEIGDKPTLLSDTANARMFARLNPISSNSPLCPKDTSVCWGTIDAIMYTFSLGDADFLEEATEIIKSQGIKPEGAPQGNWAKNYAALAIHRRENWTVTAKGFSNLVYSPERYYNENEYGLFEMHGAVLIANSEEALRTKPVDAGWAWEKIPGTTSLGLTYVEMRNVAGNRYTNSKKFAGAVSIIGKARNKLIANGAFGMDFGMPVYWFKVSGHPLQGKRFDFKKSVFFFDDILVFLGSGLSSDVNAPVLTTLFQDTVTSLSVSMDTSALYFCHGPAMTKNDFSGDVQLVDVHGNRYHVPAASSRDLVLARAVTQFSMKSKGLDVKSQGFYCTAWFDHGLGTGHSPAAYEYFVQVNSTKIPLAYPGQYFKVLMKSSSAHVVKSLIKSTYGYVVFTAGAILPVEGPLKSVSAECLLMVEQVGESLVISVSYPQMNLGIGHIPTSAKEVNPDFCKDGIPTDPLSANYRSAQTSALFFCAEDKGKTIDVQLHDILASYDVMSTLVDGEEVAADDVVQASPGALRILGMKHGKSTEVHLRRR